jgi:hypothetical protein
MRTRREFIKGGVALLAAPLIIPARAASACDFVSFTPYTPPASGGGSADPSGGGGGGGGALGGCSLRPDSIEGLNPDFRDRVAQMIASVNMDLGGQLRVYSAYRSIAHQAELYRAAVIRYGSEQAAQAKVAVPGRSLHQFGLAVDVGWNTCATGVDYGDHPIDGWLSANLPRFGLVRRLANEGWHIEPIGGVALRDQMIAAARGNEHLPLPEVGESGVPAYGTFNPSSATCQEILRDLPLGGLMPWGGTMDMTSD